MWEVSARFQFQISLSSPQKDNSACTELFYVKILQAVWSVCEPKRQWIYQTVYFTHSPRSPNGYIFMKFGAEGRFADVINRVKFFVDWLEVLLRPHWPETSPVNYTWLRYGMRRLYSLLRDHNVCDSAGAQNTVVGNLCDFGQKSPSISETVRDAHGYYGTLIVSHRWRIDPCRFRWLDDTWPGFQGHGILTSPISQKRCVLGTKLL